MGRATRVLWFSAIWATAAISVTAFIGSDWIESKDNEDLKCGLIKYSENGRGISYGDDLDDIPVLWWQYAAICGTVAVGCAVLVAITALATPVTSVFDISIHYIMVFVTFLLFACTILVLLGFNDVGKDNNVTNSTATNSTANSTTTTTTTLTSLFHRNCKICGAASTAFVLEDCSLGLHFILLLISLLMSTITCAIGRIWIVMDSTEGK